MDVSTQAVFDYLMQKCGVLIQDAANLAGDLAVARARIAELQKEVADLTPKETKEE